MNSERGGWITTSGNIITIVLYSRVLRVHKLNPNLKFNSISSSLSEIVLRMEVTFEQASNNTVDVEFVVRLSPLALPAPEHRLAFHPQLPFHQRSLSETENLRSYLVNFCITSIQTLHTQCLLVHHYLLSVSDALRIQLFVQQCMKDPSLKAPSVRWRLLTDSQAVGQC